MRAKSIYFSKAVLVTLLIGADVVGCAQVNVDSLERLLAMERVPVERLKLMKQLYMAQDPAIGLHYASAMVALADSLLVHGTKDQREVLIMKGDGLFRYAGLRFSEGPEANNDSLHACYERAVELWRRSGDQAAIARAARTEGWIHYKNADHQAAIPDYKAALSLYEELRDTTNTRYVHDQLGQCYYSLGDYPRALEHRMAALAMAEQMGRLDLAGRSLIGVGLIYQDIGEPDTAIVYYERALEAFKNDRSYPIWLTPASNIIDALTESGDHDEALRRGNALLDTIALDEWPMEVCILYKTMGVAHRSAGNMEQAIRFGRLAVTMGQLARTEGLNGDIRYFGTLTELGRTLHVAGQSEEALALAMRAKELGEARPFNLQKRRNLAQLLSDIYTVTGPAEQALKYYREYVALDDSINSDEIQKKIRLMDMHKQEMADSLKAEENRHVRELAHQEEMSAETNRKRLFMFGSIGVLLVAGGLWSRLRYTRRAKRAIEKEHDRSENLLLNILPAEIAAELKEKGRDDARDFEMVSILFTDFKGFTEASAKVSAQELVTEINTCFEAFDAIMGKYGVEKIKTIGDAYMAAGGLPVPKPDSVKNTVLAALEMQDFIRQRKAANESQGKPAFEMRVGIHTGPVVAGIVGVKKFQYDIWGDTVNTASRMESSGEVGQVNISEATYELVKNETGLAFTPRGKVQAKGKGEMEMYFVSSV